MADTKLDLDMTKKVSTLSKYLLIKFYQIFYW